MSPVGSLTSQSIPVGLIHAEALANVFYLAGTMQQGNLEGINRYPTCKDFRPQLARRDLDLSLEGRWTWEGERRAWAV